MKLAKYLNDSIEVAQQLEQQQTLDAKLTNLFSGRPFYCGWLSYLEPDYCTNDNPRCFNHIIGMPTKDGREYPLFDYERNIINILEDQTAPQDIKAKQLWIKKSTGLGISELILRYIAWICLRDNKLAYSHICLITGPRIDLAISLTDRLKGLFTRNNIVNSFEYKSTVLYLNNVRIESFPSHHIDSMRGLQNVTLVFLDESDYFPPGQQQDARVVSERYIGKSNPHIIMVSTPGRPGGLFENIENEPEDTCIYNRLKLDYTYGINKIYSEQDIAKAKASPSFKQEYCLQYGGSFGDIFLVQDVDAITSDPYSIKQDLWTTTYMGIDPAFGSSEFAIVIIRMRDNKLEVVYADSFKRPLYSDIVNTVRQLINEFHVCKVLIDGSAAHLIKELKHSYKKTEYQNYHLLFEDIIRGWESSDCTYNKIVPINFRTRHKSMLETLVQIVSKRLIRVDNNAFPKLTVALRTAKSKGEMDYDKQQSSYSDLLDALMLSCIPIRFTG